MKYRTLVIDFAVTIFIAVFLVFWLLETRNISFYELFPVKMQKYLVFLPAFCMIPLACLTWLEHKTQTKPAAVLLEHMAIETTITEAERNQDRCRG